MGIDPETVESGLAALTVAAAEMMEDMHPVALEISLMAWPQQDEQIVALKRVGQDLAALADAAAVLVRRGRRE